MPDDVVPPGTTCGRLMPYRVHETRSAGGRRCGRPAVDLGGPQGRGEEPRCAVHRGVDRRTRTNRANRQRRDRLLSRRPFEP